MPIGRILFLAFLLIPIAEIYVLIRVGSIIGAFSTIALIVFTAVLGSVLIRAQGLATLARVRNSLEHNEIPAVELMEGMCLLVAGALLLTPGFVTDSIGFILLIPPLRRSFILALLERGILRPATGRGGAQGATTSTAHSTSGARVGPTADSNRESSHGQVIEGEFEREDC
jgi:UPF0716 protein FxsA